MPMTYFTHYDSIGPSAQAIYFIRQIAYAYNNVMKLNNGKLLKVDIN